MLTTDEVAHITRVTPATVRNWLRRGLLIGVKLGKFWLIEMDELQKFLYPDGGGDGHTR